MNKAIIFLKGGVCHFVFQMLFLLKGSVGTIVFGFWSFVSDGAAQSIFRSEAVLTRLYNYFYDY